MILTSPDTLAKVADWFPIMIIIVISAIVIGWLVFWDPKTKKQMIIAWIIMVIMAIALVVALCYVIGGLIYMYYNPNYPEIVLNSTMDGMI
jgi:hypothetical protein